MNPDIILQIFLPCKATGSWQVYVFLKIFILPFPNFKSRILNMFWFICYFLLILLDSQSLITCPISAKEEPEFFFLIFVRFFPPIHLSFLSFFFFFFFFFHLVLSLLGSWFILDCVFLSYNN